MTVLNLNATDHLTAKMFFDEGGPIGVVRYDEVKYPFLKKLAKNMRGFYWTPEEIDVNKDRSDFSKLPVHEQEIFTKSLLRVILLDSVQGRAPAEMFNPVTSLPELENLVTTWTFFENIHSESYTHIIQNVYATSKEVFMGMTTDPFIKECAEDISKHYDDYAKMMYRFKAFGFGKFSITDEDGNTQKWNMTPYAIKKKLWLMLMSINALEGLRFYSNFAIFFNMAERSMMEGTAKLIRLICR
jgi:ribonucleoside-diphosphate reductase beta chain